MQDPEHQCKFCKKVWIGLEVDCPYCELEATKRLKAKGWHIDSMNIDFEILNMQRERRNAL